MKPQISLVCSNRVDSYEGDSVGRFVDSVESNCKDLQDMGLDYEYIVAEWSPVDQYLYKHPRTKHLFDQYNLKDVIIDRSVVEAENLHPTKFFEYFAKNSGIRRTTGDVILVLNADIVLTRRMVQEIAELISAGVDRKHFYRAHLRTQIHPEDKRPLWTDELHNPVWADSIVCGCYSGDFLLVHRDVMMDVAQGYDETNPNHRLGFQNALDGEILFQMNRKGVTLKFVNSPYCHLYHSKERQYDSRAYNTAGYENKPDWGYVGYKSTQEVPDKLEIIHT